MRHQNRGAQGRSARCDAGSMRRLGSPLRDLRPGVARQHDKSTDGGESCSFSAPAHTCASNDSAQNAGRYASVFRGGAPAVHAGCKGLEMTGGTCTHADKVDGRGTRPSGTRTSSRRNVSAEPSSRWQRPYCAARRRRVKHLASSRDAIGATDLNHRPGGLRAEAQRVRRPGEDGTTLSRIALEVLQKAGTMSACIRAIA